MGFVEKQTIYSLEFEDDFEGLVVKTTVPPMGVTLDLQNSFGALAQLIEKAEDDFTADDIKLASGEVTGMVDTFLENLVSWNVEGPDGAPVPADRDGLRKVSSRLGNHVIKTWFKFITGDVSGPKDELSSSGKRSLEGSLPMEPLSPSRAS